MWFTHEFNEISFSCLQGKIVKRQVSNVGIPTAINPSINFFSLISKENKPIQNVFCR